MKIGTHDSVTGEKGYGVLSFLGTPFSKTQSKTIDEPYKVGCRYFDIRVKKTDRGWICAHGLWQSKRLAEDVLKQINEYGDCYIRVVYEGVPTEDYEETVDKWIDQFSNIKFGCIAYKYPQWTNVKVINNISCVDSFLALDFRSWHTFLPIPWLWKKIYYNTPVFNNDYYTMVDFL